MLQILHLTQLFILPSYQGEHVILWKKCLGMGQQFQLKTFISPPLVQAKRAHCEAEGGATGGELYFLYN